MTLTCYGIFDVDPYYLPYLLELDEDMAVMTEYSIIVYNQCPVVIDDLPAWIQTLLRRH